jgi:SAM-dependent methyltransferase
VDHPSDVAAATRFDDQAAGFDRRTGIPPEAAADIARAVLDVGAPGIVLELGAGTGEVGRHLAGLARGYVGVDLSGPMLEVFRSKLAGATRGRQAALLVQADGDRPWPVRGGSVGVVFASRAAHLLDRHHVVGEVLRVCRPGGRFVVGRIERSGVKQDLRREREARLADRGVAAGRSGGRRTQAVLDALVAAGGVAQPRRRVASWTVATTAADVIAGWDTMQTMGGQTVSGQDRVAVLAELREWATGRFGDLDLPQPSVEVYTLEGVRLG